MEYKSVTPADTVTGVATSRRQDVRLEPPPQLVCSVAGSSARFHVRDLSIGGLALWSSMPLRRDTPHEFRIAYGDLCVVRSGRAVHCKCQNDGRWILGIAFLDDAHPGPTIEELLDAMTTVDYS